MADGRRGAVAMMKSIETLFRVGAVGGMADAELLELFLNRQDAAECAFEALVQRHGSMVLGVCRGILPDSNDAEDAFQATFLILARRASSVRSKGSLGSWLHGVARRVALRAKADATRRRLREHEAAGLRPERELKKDDTRDLSRILHEELGRLPDKYQMPVLLCDAEGLTHESAARRLGWPVGTVSGRLSRAHRLLRDRLKRRGVEPTSIVIGAITVPAAWIGSTARAAVPFAAKGGIQGAAGAVPSGAIALAEGVLKMVSITRMIVAGAVVMAGVGLTTGVGVIAVRGQGAADGPKAEAAKEEHAKAPRESEAKPRTVDFGWAPNPEVLKAIREAAKVAEAISLPGKKTATFIAIAEAYAKAGDRESARAAYQTALRVVEEAKQRKEIILEPTNNDSAQFQLNENLRLRGDSRAPYGAHISGIAESQVVNGFIQDAVETVKKHPDKYRPIFLYEFAKAAAYDGDIPTALRLAEAAKVVEGDISGAYGPPVGKGALLMEIAHIQAKDFPKSDRSWIDKLTDPAVKSRVLLGVAAGLSGQPYTPSRYRRPKPQ